MSDPLPLAGRRIALPESREQSFFMKPLVRELVRKFSG